MYGNFDFLQTVLKKIETESFKLQFLKHSTFFHYYHNSIKYVNLKKSTSSIFQSIAYKLKKKHSSAR